MENLIVYVIGILAVLYIVRKAYLAISGKGGCKKGKQPFFSSFPVLQLSPSRLSSDYDFTFRINPLLQFLKNNGFFFFRKG